MIAAALVIGLALTFSVEDEVAALRPAGDGQALNLGDLGPYRAALSGKPSGEAVAVTFRQLWDEPARYEGRRVRVEGQILRRFRQGAYGTFPPLAEVWAVGPAGDPFCLVYPDPNPGSAASTPENDAAPGASARFEGVFLRQIRYQGGDAPRLAPLIVGEGPPLITIAAPARVRLDDPGALGGLPRRGWVFAFVAAALFAVILARRHLQTPYPGRRQSPRDRDRDRDPPPEFIDA